MNMNELVLVSVDDHLVEPPDMFDAHIPAKYADDVPKLIQREDGTDAWVFEGQEATNVGLNAVAGRPPDEYGAEPTKLSEIRKRCLRSGIRSPWPQRSVAWPRRAERSRPSTGDFAGLKDGRVYRLLVAL